MEPEPWYVLEGKRGQQCLDRGEVGRAKEIFEAILARLGDAPTYGRAVILERLGRCLHLGGQTSLAAAPLRDSLQVLGSLPPSDAVTSLRGTLRSELGDVLRALGEYADARKAYDAALKIAEASNDRRAQAIELGRLAALALDEGQQDKALTRQQAALALCQQIDEPATEAFAHHQLARVLQQRGDWGEAERHYREAARLDRHIGNTAHLGRHLNALAELLQHQPGRLAEARPLVEEAVALGLRLEPAGTDVWKSFGLLADVIENEAALAADERERARLQREARDNRHLHEYAPRILAAFARLRGAPSCGKAVILERLGCCFHMAGRPDLAIAPFIQALGVTEQLAPADVVKGLRGTLHSDLGDALTATGHQREAQKAYEAALKVATERRDVRGQALASHQLGRVIEEPSQAEADEGHAVAFQVDLYDQVMTDYAFDTDLLVEGRREQRITRWTGELNPLPDAVQPVLSPRARTWLDDRGAIRFSLPLGEPMLERDPDCTVMQRTRRDVAVKGESEVLWQLIRRIDGMATTVAILSDLPAPSRPVAALLLSALAATGVIDASGRAIGRFLHSTTKKGVLPAGGLGGEEVLRLATDGDYRAYPAAPKIAVGRSAPEGLRAFRTLTRTRRSSRHYGGLALKREDFDAMLDAACGVTGAMPWGEREVRLRAYPSSGALYAVEIYPIVFRVEGLDAAIYHYRAVESVLEQIRSVERARIVAAALPVEREMVESAAAMICLAGVFPRHERKYGEGGYRMLVAEAGHISQNLILAATALGASARPFGGVFDDLLNHDLGFEGSEEQFLLSVLVGGSPAQNA